MAGSPLLTLVLLLRVTTLAFAAGITGRWLGNVSTPDGDFELVYNFQVDGETLTGTLTTPGGDIPLRRGGSPATPSRSTCPSSTIRSPIAGP